MNTGTIGKWSPLSAMGHLGIPSFAVSDGLNVHSNSDTSEYLVSYRLYETVAHMLTGYEVDLF